MLISVSREERAVAIAYQVVVEARFRGFFDHLQSI